MQGYTIAIRDTKKTMWIEVGRVATEVQKFQIKDLQEEHEYLIRIFARNEVGLSEPLESEDPYKVLHILGNLKSNTFSGKHVNNIFLFLYFVPTDQDKAEDEQRTEITEPTGFSTENTFSWMREHNMDADIKSYARGRLLRKDEYFFRIWHYAKDLFK